MRLRSSLNLSFTFTLFTGLILAVVNIAGGGCAGVKQQGPTGGGNTGGSGGQGGGGNATNSPVPEIPGLSGLYVMPPEATVALTGTNGQLSGTQQLVATGTVNGADQPLTAQVKWSTNFPGASINTTNAPGLVTITAPGTYTITAQARVGSMTYSANSVLTATFSGDIFGTGFNMGSKAVLDGNTGGSAELVYPLDHALFPSNLSPIYAQIKTPGTAARLTFTGSGTTVSYYAICETGMPGTGCAVKLPLSLTRLFVAPSEKGDMMLTARVLGSGGSPVETQAISVAWASVGLSGGLYYWSTIPNPPQKPKGDTSGTPMPPNYILLDPKEDATMMYSGTAIYRYAFASDDSEPVPEQVWTDDGGPKSDPAYNGAPPAINNNVAKGHCIGCHSISNDGLFMALTIGGSAAEAANFAMLDIGKQSLVQLSTNPNAANATPSSNPVEYWRQFRAENLATENTWGPKNNRVVSMFKSKLWLTEINVTSGTLMGTAARLTAVVPTWQAQEAYASDPFWSQDGKLFAFTSFASPSIGLYNDTGLNGDMKKGGQIVIATADDAGVHDDAKVLVRRDPNVTSFYPSISNDNALVVFNQSTCAGEQDDNKTATDYGKQTCDGYDDSSAKLWVVAPGGGATTRLDKANGTGAFSNSWPRFSPDKGTFRGTDLYWIAFSSRRPYGVQVNNTTDQKLAKPQLWIAGVTKGGEFVSDPSFAPVWLPAQNPKPTAPTGNHVPQWVKVAVIID